MEPSRTLKPFCDAHIRAYIPLPDWEHMTPFYGPSKFSYDAEHDRYLCPQGQPLLPFPREYTAQKVEYRADAATCNACPLKAQCTPSDQGRQVHRSFHASYLERVRNYQQTQAYQKALNKRKVWVELLFARSAKTGMACAVSVSDGSGASLVKHWSRPPVRISNACFANEGGDAVHSLQRQ